MRVQSINRALGTITLSATDAEVVAAREKLGTFVNFLPPDCIFFDSGDGNEIPVRVSEKGVRGARYLLANGYVIVPT